MATFADFAWALDARLLDLATAKDGDLFLTIPEYEEWRRTFRLTHVARVRVLHDIVAKISNDLFLNSRDMSSILELDLPQEVSL